MKLQSISTLLLIATTELVVLVNSVCVVRDSSQPYSYWYQCSRLNADYLVDLNKSPILMSRITLTNSNIPVLRNGSFSRVGNLVVLLVVSDCELKEIEDNAFEGLPYLNSLDLSRNKLTVVKGTWFEGITSIKHITLKYNQISHIDDTFFTTIPRLTTFDLSNNQLKCLSVSSMNNFYIREYMDLTNNPLTWKCGSIIFDWGKRDGYIRVYLGGFEITHNITKSCIEKSPTPDPEDNFVDTCVEATLNKLLPAEENYTIERLCQFLVDQPSSYLNCEQ